MEQVQTAAQSQDTVSLSGRSYEDRLSELRKLHKETDYSGMNDKEIFQLLQTRFNDAFPNYWAIMGGFYNCAGENTIYAKVLEEKERQFLEANGGETLKLPSDPTERKETRRYIYGYDEDLSDEELIAKLNEKYSAGTLKDRCGMAWEMMHLGLIDHHVADATIMQIQNEMVKGTEGQYGYLHRDNPLRVNAMIGCGENTAISWTQLMKNIYAERETWRYENEAIKQQTLFALEEGLNQFLDRLGLSKTSFT